MALALRPAPLSICVAGRIGSGKSKVSQELARLTHRPFVVSFGNYLRARLESENYPMLQDVGDVLATKHTGEFCDLVLKHHEHHQGEPQVVEGIRHLSVYEELKPRLDTPTVLVFVERSESLVVQQLSQSGISEDEAARLMGDRTEEELIDLIPSRADFRVRFEESMTAEQVAIQIMEKLHLGVVPEEPDWDRYYFLLKLSSRKSLSSEQQGEFSRLHAFAKAEDERLLSEQAERLGPSLKHHESVLRSIDEFSKALENWIQKN